MNDLAALLKAIHFAADKHRDQRRKDLSAAPYVNHVIEVADIIAQVGGVTDIAVLQGAVLHDTVEDTMTTPEEIEAQFGPRVRHIVAEVTDDKTLPKNVRKQLQIDHAPSLSVAAKLVKLADKISNVSAIANSPPKDWPHERKVEYLDWTLQVVNGLRGVSSAMEARYDALLELGRKKLAGG